MRSQLNRIYDNTLGAERRSGNEASSGGQALPVHAAHPEEGPCLRIVMLQTQLEASPDVHEPTLIRPNLDPP